MDSVTFFSKPDPERTFTWYVTFDCDPVNFDASLSYDRDIGFNHLKESIPIVLQTLKSISKQLGNMVRATFFIRNITMDKQGKLKLEPWDEFDSLWREVTGDGHKLGLHPHVYIDLTTSKENIKSQFKNQMKLDFEALSKYGVSKKISRVGGHHYSRELQDQLLQLGVTVDSSAIPGRHLNEDERLSNWKEIENEILSNWFYLDLATSSFGERGMVQVPMTTLRSQDLGLKPRYIDFSFIDFDSYKVDYTKLLNTSSYAVSITHPSTMLESFYFKHQTLNFGFTHWKENFYRLMDVCTRLDKKLKFSTLDELV